MTTPLKKGKKACTECRQQKAKCDVYLDPSQPCSRCRKVNATCIISDPFKRVHKRKRLSDLERESDELRRRLRTSESTDPHPSPISLLPAAADIGIRTGSGSDVASDTSLIPTESYNSQLSNLTHGDITKSRSLNDIQVTSEEIDDIFQIFFRYYAQFLPILDPRHRPNAFYAQSPFLFWTVIGVSCRYYPRNPTLYQALAHCIKEMAFLSALSTCPPWHTIQGLLILLTWPFPKGDHPDVTFPLGGFLLHVAMQNGLHIPMSSHEFSRSRLPIPSENDLLRRSELWAHSIIVYQRVCVTKGQLPRANQAQDPAHRHILLENIAPWMALKIRCQDLIARCSVAVLENGIRSMSPDQERSLDVLLASFEDQLDKIEPQAVTDDEKFDIFICRMAIQSFHFFKVETIVSSNCFPRILMTACNIIDCIQSLTVRVSCLAMIPVQMCFGLLLASTSLLRILKSNNGSKATEAIRARSSLFTAINLAKQMTVDSNDLAARTVTVLNSIWNSRKAFRKADGSEYLALRIRSRLVLSPVLDTVWWWRDEFDPQLRVRGPETVEALGIDPNPNPVFAGPSNTVPDSSPFHLDEQFLADFEWALGDDALLSLDPLPLAWSSTNTLL